MTSVEQFSIPAKAENPELAKEFFYVSCIQKSL